MAVALIALLIFVVLAGIVLFAVIFRAVERHHEILDEGWDRPLGEPPAPLTPEDEDISTPTPKRAIEESQEVVESFLAAINAPEAPEPPQEAPEPPEDIVTGPMERVPSLPFNPPKPEQEFATGGIADPSEIDLDPEPVIETVIPEPKVDLVARIAKDSAGKPPGEFKKWNKP
jgi:hypothetical protein